jgi:hypothetical protein
LSKRFEKFANAFFIRFNRRAPRKLFQLRAGCRTSIWVLLSFLCLAHLAREQSEQDRHRDQQNEKEILDLHLFYEVKKSYNVKSLTRYIGSRFTDHVPSLRDLSPPAIDSRMEVSA